MPRQTPYLAAGLVLCALLCSTPPALAQLAPSGGSFAVDATFVRGNASAYDSKNNRFLAIGAAGSVMGRLVNPDASFAGPVFQIDMATGYCQYPSVSYSPDADSGRGAYLVTWHQNIGVSNFVHTRLVSATGVPLGAPVVLGGEATFWETAPNVDYASVSHVFMVTWRIGAYQIRAARIGLAGQNLDPGLGIPVTTTGGEQSPSIAYNPDTDNFLVVYTDFLPPATHVYGRLVSASSGALGAAQLLGAGTATYLCDATFSTGAHKYFVGWYQLPGGTTGRLVNADGTPSGDAIPLSSRFGTYDSMAVAYNVVTRTTLVAGSDLYSFENGGAELSESGIPRSEAVLTNAGGPNGNFYPQVSASTAEGKWMLTTAHNFNAIVAQFATAPTPPVAPSVTTNPSSQDARNGQLVTFSAVANGNPTPTVKWQVRNVGSGNWIDISSSITPTSTATYTFWAAPRDTNKQFRATFTNSLGSATSAPATIHIVGIHKNDFDGDGESDLLVWRASTGTWIWRTSSTGFTNGGSKQFGNQSLGDVPLSGDIDGDGRPDAIVWRASTGTWYWSTSSTAFASGGSRQWGNQSMGDVPMLGDMDGDGRADLVVWRASTGTWYWLTSSSGFVNGFSKQWGNVGLGDKPMLADFDGDGKADPVVWRASTGTWYWLTSSSNLTNGFMKQFGNSAMGDKPLVGDIDGDGKSDLVIWRESNGTWYWSGSSYNFTDGGSTVFGTAGDKPMLSDLDGDGSVDFILWRPSDGTWNWLFSSGGFNSITASSQQFGNLGMGDIPFIW